MGGLRGERDSPRVAVLDCGGLDLLQLLVSLSWIERNFQI